MSDFRRGPSRPGAPRPQSLPQVRERSRDTGWHADREFAETVACPGPPKGCHAPTGKTCRNLSTGHELVNQPSHEARIVRAMHAEPTTTTEGPGDPAPAPTEETTRA